MPGGRRKGDVCGPLRGRGATEPGPRPAGFFEAAPDMVRRGACRSRQ